MSTPPSKQKNTTINYLALGITVGIAIGTAIGVATDQLGVGIGLGIGIGVAIGLALQEIRRRRASSSCGENPPKDEDSPRLD